MALASGDRTPWHRINGGTDIRIRGHRKADGKGVKVRIDVCQKLIYIYTYIHIIYKLYIYTYYMYVYIYTYIHIIYSYNIAYRLLDLPARMWTAPD